MLTFTAEHLRQVTSRVFQAAGASVDIADHVAKSLVASNLAGHDSHGVIRIPSYIEQVNNGRLIPDARPTVTQETANTVLVNGNRAFGQISATMATEIAVAKARQERLAAVGIIQCNHIGRLGEYAELAAESGVITMVVVGGGGIGGIAVPFGGAGRALSTNPLAFGVPCRQADPMIVDIATTTVAEGKVRVARAKREQLPPGWIVDKEGRPSTTPDDLYDGGALLPFGGHKGYALSVMVDILAGPFIGADAVPDRIGMGTFVLAMDAAMFRPIDQFEAAVAATYDRIKGVPPAPGFDEVLVPGEPELRSRAQRLEQGIPVPEDTWQAILSTAADLGLKLDTP